MKQINLPWTVVLSVAVLIGTTGCSQLGVSQKPSPTPTSVKPTTPSPSPSKKAALPPEPKTPVIAVNISREPNQSNNSDALKAIPLAGGNTAEFLDIRGVGDSAMADTHRQPLTPSFGQRLDGFDRTGKSYRGDLSFINWETTVGLRCQRFWAGLGPQSFAFISHPDNLVQAYQRGFNLIGLANNHARDCPSGEKGADGASVSARHLEELTQKIGAKWLWHGVGKQKTAQVKTLTIKGRPVKVAFASLYIAAGDCTYVTCIKDEKTVLRSLRDADADIRILAMHSWTDETQQQLVNIGVNFIRNYNGDIVFGHGPHRWQPVRIVQSSTGKKGVLFESLGNFIHPALVPQSQNIIGRALFDLKTLKLRQVQVIPVYVNRVYASFNGAPNPTALKANLTWKTANDATWKSGVNASVRAAYSNIKP
jgi:poly-gamma-glutamate synthesis protein (capsule biosynthesis protein)